MRSIRQVLCYIVEKNPLHSHDVPGDLYTLKKIFNVYLLLRERQGASRGGAERGRPRIWSRLRFWAVSTEPDVGLELTNREIMTWARFGRLPTEPPRWPIGDLYTLYHQCLTAVLERMACPFQAHGLGNCFAPAVGHPPPNSPTVLLRNANSQIPPGLAESDPQGINHWLILYKGGP